jgi:NAD(P)-dependent dehydrogenase (short-subunit alcohol dehydrogenase family)
MIDPNQNVALVTGGSRGIGRAISLRLAEAGFTVIVNYLNNEVAANQLCQEIVDRRFPPAFPMQADVSQLLEVKRLFTEIKQQFGGLSVLVNNAGIIGDGLFLMTRDQDWWEVFKNNVGSVVNCCRLALPLMIAKRSGTIINLTSISGQRGAAGQTAYSASKAAIVGFSKSLAREVSPYGISINCVSPGLIETEMIHSLKPEVIQQRIANNPVQRLGQPEEVAEVVALLASGRSQYLFGQVISIDGGATM